MFIEDLKALQERLGAPPRTLGPSGALPVRRARDPLRAVAREFPAIMRRGRLARGFVYMAKAALFEPGIEDLPAGVVYSFDPAIWRQPALLETVGDRLLGFYAGRDGWHLQPPLSPAARQLLDAHHTGLECSFHRRVPRMFSGGWAMYASTLLCVRAHLPGGRLLSQHVPLLVDVDRETGPPLAAVVPAALWPERLLRHTLG